MIDKKPDLASVLRQYLPEPKRIGADSCYPCPYHEDGKRPNLRVNEKKQVWHCDVCNIGGDVIEFVMRYEKIDFKAAMAKLGLNGHSNGHAKAETKPKEVCAYEYVSETGEHLFEVVRGQSPTGEKTFWQRHRSEYGTMVKGSSGIRRVLYRLPAVLRAVSEQRLIIIAEGEKDVDRLVQEGFTATCNSGGAGKWQEGYTATLRGAVVAIIADKDEPGRKHANTIARALLPVAKSVKVLEVPTGKDASDFFDAGGTAAALHELIERTPAYSGGTDDPWLAIVEDAADIINLELPPIVEIVEGLVTEQSKFVIGSGSKSFKTWATIDLSLSIAHGRPFLDRETTRRRVLYVNLELKQQTFQRRVQVVAKAKGITVEPAWFHHLPLRGQIAGMTVDGIISRIIAIAKHLGSQVLIIDPVYKMNLEGEENNSRDQTLFFNQLDRLTTEAGCAVILNDHFSKGNQSEKDPLDAIRGSSAKGGDVDAALVMRRHDVEGAFRVDVIHRELPPIEPFVIGWQFPLMVIREDLSPDDMKKAKGGRKKEHDPMALLSAIADTDKEHSITISDWAAKVNMPRQTLTGYLPTFRARGCIATVGDGKGARQYITLKGRSELKEIHV